MKRMLAIAGLVLAGMIGTAALAAATGTDAKWTEDYKAALEQAKKEKKLLLIDCLGSDWCDPCMLQKKKVFDTPEFSKWAKDKFVLVSLDYPVDTPQNEAIKKQNKELKEKFKIEAYPTTIIMNADEKEICRTLGYKGQTPAEWTVQQDEAIAKAQGK